MRKRKTTDVKKFAIGAGLAAAAGYLTGILTAPKSGQQTRQDIKDTTQKGLSEAEKDLKKLHDELDGLVGDLKDKGAGLSDKTSKELNDLVDKAKTSKDKARELLNAARGGKAEDVELKKAIAEAGKAIDHVRKYLKK